jgi:Na+-driven multidrug efflux pump
LCQGLQPIIGYNYGAGRYDRLKRAFWLATIASLVITSVGAAFGQAFPSLIARAFNDNEALIAATVNSLSISLTLFYVVGFQIVATTFLQSIGLAGKSIFLSLVRQVIFLIPFLLILPQHFGLDGVWASFPTADVFSTTTAALMIWWEMRQLGKRERLVRG